MSVGLFIGEFKRESQKTKRVTAVEKRMAKRGFITHFARGVWIFVTLSIRIMLKEALKSSVMNITATYPRIP